TNVPLRLTDTSTISVIRKALDTDDTLKVTQAIGWIEQMGADAWTDELTVLARHADAGVRRAALHALADADLVQDEQVTQTLRRALQDQDAAVRRAAVDGLGELTDVLIGDLRQATQDTAAQVRYSALQALARHGDTDALQQLELRLHDAGPERPLALAALAGGGHLTGTQLQQWFEGDDIPLLQAALEALPAQGPTPWKRLAQLLLVPELRGHARDALRRCAQHAPDELVALCHDANLPARHRAQLVRLFGEIDHDHVFAALLELAMTPHNRVRGAAVSALLNRRRHFRVEPIDSDTVDTGLTTEIGAAEVRHSQVQQLGEGDDGLLIEALEQRRSQSLDRALMWCDLGHEQLAHRRLTDSLRGNDRRRRGAALELLDEVLEHDHASRLLPLLEDGHPSLQGDAAAVLQDLATSQDTWLRAGAIRAIGQRQQQQLTPLVEVALRDEEPRVREAAIEAVILLSPLTSVAAMDDLLADADYVEQNPLCQRFSAPTPAGARAMPLSTFEKVFFLRSVELFSPLTGEEIAALAEIVEERELAAGEKFITRGDEGDCLWVVVEGQARVDLITQERHVGPREVIGELAIIAHRPRSADCFADTAMLLLHIDQVAFWELLETRQEIAMQIMKVLVERYVPAEG
ncbi:MAG: cyclic nucleotide-binding domain-containing protein, partial [Gemmatimonadetes bacterium]|nr:cyclic nucleotide-binding domain-containing protein [Gemmatimonadota bacterium]